MSKRVCQGCGDPLPTQHHRRKWCSERCRRTTLYSGTCVDCGDPTYNGNVPPPGRCHSCSIQLNGPRVREHYAPHRQRVEEMWADGWTSRQIGNALGITSYPEQYIVHCRSRGYNLPHRRTPEQVARMGVGAAERMAKARAARKVAA